MAVTFTNHNPSPELSPRPSREVPEGMFASLYQTPSDYSLLQQLVADVEADASAAAASAASAAAVTGLSNIAARSQAIAARAGTTAMFLYDTRNDSGGGAWRFKCAHTSWERELGQWPQRTLWFAAGTSTAKVVTVFNCDDPRLPVYMMFSGATIFGMISATDTTINAIHCRDGHICFAGSNGGLVWLDLIEDRQRRGPFSQIVVGGISNRNNTNAANRIAASRVGALANNITYDVVIYPVPGTPGNPERCGLPDPVILVGTASGLSVVMPDGVTVRSSSSAAVCYGTIMEGAKAVVFTPNIALTRPVQFAEASFNISGDVNLLSTLYPLYFGGSVGKVVKRPGGFASFNSATSNPVVTSIIYNAGRPELSFFAAQSSNIMTGFMLGASTFAIQATSAYTGAAAAGSNLVTNGDFPTDLTGWTVNVAGASTVTQSAGVMQLVRAAGATCRGYQSFATTIGKGYTLSFDVTGNVAIWLGTTTQATDVGSFSATGSRRINFIATSSTTHLTFAANTDATHTVDNVNCREAIVDLSKFQRASATMPAANDFDIVGSLNRTAIASGSDVYGFSGFSASNYLRSINTLTGPGSGDFTLQAAFVGTTNGGNQTIFEWCDSPYTGAGIRLYMNSSGAILAQTTANGFASASTITSPLATYGDAVPHIVWLIRRALRMELWIDGELVVSGASAETLTNAGAIFAVGCNVLATGNHAANLTLGMLRGNLSAAPDRALIPQAMREELAICQTNVTCLLPAGNATSIAGDERTGAIIVGTTAGAVVLRGLAKTATYLGTSATNKFGNPGFARTSATATLPDGFVTSLVSGVTITQTGSGELNGERYIDLRFSGTPTATGTVSCYIGSLTRIAAANGQQWFFNLDAALSAGALTNVSSITARLASLNSGGTFLANLTALNLASITSTLARQAGVAATHSNASTAFTQGVISVGVTNGQAIDLTLRISRPFMAQGASEPATWTPGLSNSSSVLAVAINDNDVFIADSFGVNAHVLARPMREGVMLPGDPAKPPTLFQVRTSDATATRIWQFPVYEAETYDLVAHVTARQYGGTIVEYARYTVRGVAKRDVNGNVTVQNVTAADYEATGTMDAAFTADTTNQTVHLLVTGKAATDLQWTARVELTPVRATIAA